MLNTFKVLKPYWALLTYSYVLDSRARTRDIKGFFLMSPSLNSQTNKLNLISLIRERRGFAGTCALSGSVILREVSDFPWSWLASRLYIEIVPSMSAVGKGWRNVFQIRPLLYYRVWLREFSRSHWLIPDIWSRRTSRDCWCERFIYYFSSCRIFLTESINTRKHGIMSSCRW